MKNRHCLFQPMRTYRDMRLPKSAVKFRYIHITLLNGCIRDTLAEYFLKEPIEGIIASGIMRLKVKDDIDPEYLALCINSIVGQMLIERDSGGSIIAHWKPEQIKRLQIPIFSKSTQQKIADLVRQSHEARKKAKELLEQAKQRVEELIVGEK